MCSHWDAPQLLPMSLGYFDPSHLTVPKVEQAIMLFSFVCARKIRENIVKSGRAKGF